VTSRTKNLGGRTAAAIIGVLMGGGVVLALDATSDSDGRPADSNGGVAVDGAPDLPPPRRESTPDQPERDITFRHRVRPSGRVLLAWTPGSVPAQTEQRLENLPEVEDATTVYAALDWLEATRAPGRRRTPVTPPGFVIPFEMAAVEPREYARFVPPAERAEVLALGDGGTLLAQTEEELRGAGRGLAIDLGERTLGVTGVVSDVATNGYEALVASPLPEWARADRFVLVHLRRPSDRATVERVVQDLMPGRPLQTRVAGENPFLRYGDAVLPQLLVKATFGEFSARPLSGGNIDIEDRWENANIRSARVPIVGRVTCHRVFIPQLREALSDVRREGLAHAVHPRQYSGCYSPRHISHDPTGRLSHHSWGMAVDLNAHENTFGARPNMDRRVVEIFEERWGLTWGGRWIIPDGMHFEWIKFP
jgi:D-alanyl-D-alanine carboxypeptidase